MKIPKTFLLGLIAGVAITAGVVLFGQMADGSRGPGGTLSAPSLGPEKAPVTLMEFADFHCPYCGKSYETVKKIIENYPGKIKWVFRHFPLSQPGAQGSFQTHRAAVCAQEKNKFWEFHNAVFSNQKAQTTADLKKIGSDIGLSPDEFEACFTSDRHDAFIMSEKMDGVSRGISGTPAFLINQLGVKGALPYEVFEKAVEAALDPAKAAALMQEEENSRLPEVVDFDHLEGRPSIGPEDAPVTLVEFSDYHCPFCKRLTPTLNRLIDSYPQKIRRVFKHFPLAIHPDAARVHEAAECAHEQGRFWEFHNQLMKPETITRNNEDLIKAASEAGLEPAQFQTCLESGKFRDLVQKEIQEGAAAGVAGTPAVFVNGRLISGAQPFEVFDSLVRDELKKE